MVGDGSVTREGVDYGIKVDVLFVEKFGVDEISRFYFVYFRFLLLAFLFLFFLMNEFFMFKFVEMYSFGVLIFFVIFICFLMGEKVVFFFKEKCLEERGLLKSFLDGCILNSFF